MGCQHGHALAECPDARCRGGENTPDTVTFVAAVTVTSLLALVLTGVCPNVVGTVVILLGVNLGLSALAAPLAADCRILHLHAPYLAAVVLLIVAALGRARRLGRGMGLVLLGLYGAYLGLNLWQEFR